MPSAPETDPPPRPSLPAALSTAAVALLLALLLYVHASASAAALPSLPSAVQPLQHPPPHPPPRPLLRPGAADPAALAAALAAAQPPLPWVRAAELPLRARQPPQRAPAGGCPPRPALCRLQDLFDEVFVLSLPRLSARANRVTAQLRALDAPFTLVHAYDLQTDDVSVAEVPDQRYFMRPGERALFLTHLRIFEYVAAAQHIATILIIEDDATLASDFPTALDAAARALPTPDWRLFYLGATISTRCALPPMDGASSLLIPRSQPCIGKFFGGFALGAHRDAAAALREAMQAAAKPIDLHNFRLLDLFPEAFFVARPAVIHMQPFFGTTIGNGWEAPVEQWMEENGVAPARFDFQGGGYSAHASRAPTADAAQCQAPALAALVQADVDYAGNDLPGAWHDPLGAWPAASARECCEKCVAGWPICMAWSYREDLAHCWLKAALAGEQYKAGVLSARVEASVR